MAERDGVVVAEHWHRRAAHGVEAREGPRADALAELAPIVDAVVVRGKDDRALVLVAAGTMV